MGTMEQSFSEKLDSLAEERPELCQTAAEIRDDVADFISKLSEKLKDREPELARDAIAEVQDRNAKSEFLRVEQERLDQLREEQERMQFEKEAALAAERIEAERLEQERLALEAIEN